ADMDTPVSSYFKLNSGTDSFLLESMEGDGHSGRYSIIGMKPMLSFMRFSDRTVITDVENGKQKILYGNPFDHLKLLLASCNFDRTEPFECGFLCGYLSYDSIKYIEKIPANSQNDVQLPEIYLILPSEVVIFDNFTHTQKLLVHIEDNGNHAALENIAADLLNAMVKKFSRHDPRIKEMKKFTQTSTPDVIVNISNEAYLQSVIRAKEYIRNGDIFQIVLSRRFQTAITCDSFDIYRMLHLINPSPYMYYINFGEVKIIGSSPETMVKFDGNRVIVRPIAGTRKRGKTKAEDKEIAKLLLKDEKELAEHVMLVDLGRNDIGRIASYGSVRLDTFKKVENYSHVMHIVSTVSGELQAEFDSVDIFKACFPAGTVSGAPKVRAMEIIDELEKTRRGPYAGAIGYFDFYGRMDTCITIRTIVVKGRNAYWQAGGGIVADSIPEYEFEETENKARALLKAISLAEEVYYDCGH
ncbi:MAG: anthranilate synthase component I, partial [bacterium]